jgi:cytosine deaminase
MVKINNTSLSRNNTPLAEKLASEAVKKAQQALNNKTFGVGGAMLGPDYQIMKRVRNDVIRDGRTHDPSAHAERQLVSWYAEQLNRGASMPRPEEITVVTTLDPCVMCSGYLLHYGFNVLTLAHDDFAGIAYQYSTGCRHDHGTKIDPDTLPEPLRQLAGDRFAYVASQMRDYLGPLSHPFANAAVDHSYIEAAHRIFHDSREIVRTIVNNDIANDIAHNVDTIGLRKHLKARFGPHYLQHAWQYATDPQSPGDGIPGLLKAEADRAAHGGHDRNAAVLLDHAGTLLMCRASRDAAGPDGHPLIRLMRDYAALRYKVGSASHCILPHPKNCVAVTLKGPYRPGYEAADLAALGTFASSMEGPMAPDIDCHLRHIEPQIPQAELDQRINGLPPLYPELVGLSARTLDA